MRQQQWAREYHTRTGRPWLAHYDRETGPRGPPEHFMWPADRVGQVHRFKAGAGDDEEEEKELELVVLSTAPRVLIVPNLLSDEECDMIVEMGRSQMVASSMTGGRQTDHTRTSRTGWLSRTASPRLDALFRRFAVTVGIPDARMQHSGPGAVAEPLQVVHYGPEQLYANHYGKWWLVRWQRTSGALRTGAAVCKPL